MIVSKNMSFEYFDKLSLDGIKSFLVKLASMLLNKCPENGL